ncbi:hypothetical protein [Nonomuraea lactucae]|uniref:hypothetical protein n=1 Tax=Nonomuraea lactucae TaxID=2249762 RepID=UPI001964CFFE
MAKVNSAFVDQVDGFSVIGTAGTGEQALARIADPRPDLVLLDLYLPDAAWRSSQGRAAGRGRARGDGGRDRGHQRQPFSGVSTQLRSAGTAATATTALRRSSSACPRRGSASS